MKTRTARTLLTPENEFLQHEQVLFNLYLKMPVQYKETWREFRQKCSKRGLEFEDVLGDLLIQFNEGGISYKGK
jgi:hypothetical protein